MRTIISLLLLAVSCSRKPPGEALHAGDFEIRLRLDPDPPVAADNVLHVELRDSQGRPVDGARVGLVYDMPAMGAMPEMKGNGESTARGSGRYDFRYALGMSGDWSISLGIEAEGHAPATLRFKVSPPREGYTVEQPVAAKPGEGQRPATLEVSPERQQLIGVVYGTVARRPLALTLRAAGRVDVDESQVTDVVLRYDAFVEKLHVARSGEPVRPGQPLLTLYSPDLYAAEQDLLIALRSSQGHVPGSEQLLRAARERLRLWNLSEGQIADIERRGKPGSRVTLLARSGGVVLEKNVVPGTRAMAGMVLYRIGNLGRIWVLADLFESDAPYVSSGQAATMTIPWAGAPLDGRVEFVYPTVDEKTRALRARLSFANARQSLKPGMFVDVRIDVPLGTRLAVPDSALLASGERRYAFVQRGEGRLEAVEVKIGARAGDWDEVLGGLQEGDRVATQATFLLSSEARLRDALPRWSTP